MIYGLIGANGSGKTLFMKAICGFLLPDTGTIHENGKQIGFECDFPENMGIIIEIPGFTQYLSGFCNLQIMGWISKDVPK